MGVSQPKVRNLFSELLLAQNKKFTSERFAALNAILTKAGNLKSLLFFEVIDKYIDYLSIYAPHLFHNKKTNPIHNRVYIEVILKVHGMDYFAPLSSYKEKHKRMKETLDFVKIKRYSVINLNNMFPVQSKDYTYLDFSKEQDLNYKSLLESEYRYIKSIQGKIIKNASL